MSKGNLPNVKEIQLESLPSGFIEFHWDGTVPPAVALGSDRSVLVVYCPELNQFEYTWTGAARMMGEAILDTRDFRDKEVHAWMAFISDNKQRASDSKYIGRITVR